MSSNEEPKKALSCGTGEGVTLSSHPPGHKKEKTAPIALNIPPKKPPLSKAERRALQEQQRAAKGQGGTGIAPVKGATNARVNSSISDSRSGSASEGPAVAVANISTSATATNEVSGSTPVTVRIETKSALITTTTDPIAARAIAPLVSHLREYHDPATFFTTSATLDTSSASCSSQSPLHPAVIELGYKYASGQVQGENERCRAMFACFRTVLHDFVVPSTTADDVTSNVIDLRQVIEQQVLKPSFQFWTTECRPHCITMGNAFSFLKAAVNALDRDVMSHSTYSSSGSASATSSSSSAECSTGTLQEQYDAVYHILCETMDAYQRERIEYANQAIAHEACSKVLRCGLSSSIYQTSYLNRSENHSKDVRNDIDRRSSTDLATPFYHEVILTYGFSEAVFSVLVEAADRIAKSNDGGLLRVIVVDARPHLSGCHLLERLQTCTCSHVIECTYVLLNALTYVLDDSVTKVLLGASGLYSDGSVLGRVGTAAVALSAHDQHIPVLVCSETYKIALVAKHVPLLDSLTQNETGSSAMLQNLDIAPCGTSIRMTTDAPSIASVVPSSSESWNALNVLYDLTPATFVSGVITELGIVPPTSVAMLLKEMSPSQ